MVCKDQVWVQFPDTIKVFKHLKLFNMLTFLSSLQHYVYPEEILSCRFGFFRFYGS